MRFSSQHLTAKFLRKPVEQTWNIMKQIKLRRGLQVPPLTTKSIANMCKLYVNCGDVPCGKTKDKSHPNSKYNGMGSNGFYYWAYYICQEATLNSRFATLTRPNFSTPPITDHHSWPIHEGKMCLKPLDFGVSHTLQTNTNVLVYSNQPFVTPKPG